MKALKFKITGNTAFFRKPDINKNYYFTFSQIHKITILGILGSILGLDGYSKQYIDETPYPEFYDKLKDLKISIVPYGDNGYFSKKIQEYNNSTGFASKEAGGTLIVREQWLQNVEWDIYIYDDGSDNYRIVKKYLENNWSEYTPYLGRTDHLANIKYLGEINLVKLDKPEHLDSLFIQDDSIDLMIGEGARGGFPFRYSEYLPYKLNELNHYEYELFTFTNEYIEINNSKYLLVSDGKINLMFY